MAYESCSIGQREGNDCGRYPTCKKNTDPSVSAGPSGVLSLNPAPENTKVVGSKDPNYPNMPIDPNYIFGSVQTTRSPFFSSYPQQPGAGSPAVFQPLYPPLNQPPVIPQAPFNFGASPHNPFYPHNPNPNPTSTEPSLWNQFLYNKQPEKRPRNGAGSRAPSPLLFTLFTLLSIAVPVLRFLSCKGVSNVYNNGPKPSAPAGRPGDDDVLGTLGLNPNNPYGQRPTPPPARPPQPAGPSLYPSLPTDNNPGNRYGGNGGGGYSGGGGSYNGGGAGGSSYNGGGGAGGGGAYNGGGQFDGAGGNIVVPTRKPAAPANNGGFFGGILSGVQNAVSNAVKQQIGTYINQRLGIGPAAGGAAGAGGLGGLFDARNLIDNKRLGGLFSENKPAGSGGGTGSSGTSIGPGGYPVTVDQRTSASSYNQQYAAAPAQSVPYPQNYGSYNAAARTRSTERPAYGWNRD
uniref:Uncharacterized protein n=1 Tax=Anopheles quadriannulatus TaxID=34691 RepID=A0A182WWK2_ANOQN